jgi:transcription antitermination factor NusG
MIAKFVVVAARPGQESRAIVNAKRQAFVPYQPVFYDYRHKVRRPLFGRYFFVDLGYDQTRWGAIRSTRGVHYVVSNNGEFSFVPLREIEKLRAMENENGVIELPHKDEMFGKYGRRPRPIEEKNFAPGQKVRVTSGAFAGEVGLYEGMTIQQCEAVLLGWLGRALVPLSDLEAA